ncbi:MAG: M13 family metallopeptidase [Flavobacteriales bacterium]|nr:M13 family metallopeptidase [Flavobacteriales bacterium]
MKKISIIATAAIFAVSCGETKKEGVKSEDVKIPHGIDVSLMDRAVQPCDNFYEYVAGTWVKNNPVPDTESRWSSFNELEKRNNVILKEILLQCSADAATAEKGSNIQKIGDYYNTAMDTIKRAEDGIMPIQNLLDKVSGLQSTEELPSLLAHFQKIGIQGLFRFSVYQDLKNNDTHICYVSQGGLGLPDKDYYFNADSNSVELREKYLVHINGLMDLADLGSDYSSIMKMETDLASASMNRTEQRDTEAQYNKRSVTQLQEMSPSFNWNTYLSELGVTIDTLIVSQPVFFANMEKVINSYSLDEWKKYLNWGILNSTASKLSPELEAKDFEFYGTTLSGAKKMKPTWERTLKSINRGMGEVLGQEYVKVAFSQEAKDKVNELVDNFMEAYAVRIKGLPWMSDSTKEQALIKLSTFTRKLGYPDKWRDYSALNIEKDSHVQNGFRISEYRFNYSINKLGKEVDKTEWGMPPQMINAYYNPVINEIVFPAAILQPPFMDIEADDAILYGTIGAVIGHEITHGFDDKGSAFDAYGNLKNWWGEEDMDKFMTQAGLVVSHFEAYEPLKDVHINGQLTLGENIADFGGLTVSYYAYQASLEGKERIDIDGFTPEQRFFIAFGQIWKGNYTDEALLQQIRTNPHSPNPYRVLGTLSQMPEFYEAFGCKPGDEMHTADSVRAIIW